MHLVAKEYAVLCMVTKDCFERAERSSTINEKPRTTSFGMLLGYYRSQITQNRPEPVSQSSLSRMLSMLAEERAFMLVDQNEEQKTVWSQAAISKFELGERRPPPYFIYATVICLKLTEDQESALLDARVADMAQNFLASYQELKEMGRTLLEVNNK